jgi:trimethylamine--corrinoid protein Co-methyltransferase
MRASVSELDLLHEATLRLLSRTGVRVGSAEVLDLLASVGVRVDRRAQRAYPGEEQVHRALASAPRSFALYGRATAAPLIVGGENAWIVAGGGSVRVLTLDCRYEPSTWEHLRQFNTLLDALPNIHVLINQVDPQGDARAGFYKRLAAEMLIGTPKPPLFQAGDAEDVHAFVEMGVAIRGSRQALRDKPIFMTGGNAEPPLYIPAHVAELHVAASREGIPSSVGDYVMMGVTGPETVAGAVVEINAIQLTALIMSQAAQPGAPFSYTCFGGSANMRTLDPLTANPQSLKLIRLAAELGHWYGLPTYSAAPVDAKMADSQAACERAVQLEILLDAGVNLIQGPTSHMDQMMLSSFVQAVIDDEIAGYVLAAHGRPEITEETLALDVIGDVVAEPTLQALKFAAHPHTVRHLRADLWEPRVFIEDGFLAWQAIGAPTVYERAESIAREILASHCPEPLPAATEAQIREIAGAIP